MISSISFRLESSTNGHVRKFRLQLGRNSQLLQSCGASHKARSGRRLAFHDQAGGPLYQQANRKHGNSEYGYQHVQLFLQIMFPPKGIGVDGKAYVMRISI